MLMNYHLRMLICLRICIILYSLEVVPVFLTENPTPYQNNLCRYESGVQTKF